MNRLFRRGKILVFCLFVLAMVGGPSISAARQAQIAPQIAFPRELLSRVPMVYVDLSITDGDQRYSTGATIDRALTNTATLALVGVPRGRNYILVARASANPAFPPDSTTVRKALFRATRFTSTDVIYPIAVNLASTDVAEAVELFLANTGLDLNSVGIDAYLDQIENPVAPDTPGSVAIELSTTQVTGTVQDVRSQALGSMTVSIEGNPGHTTQTGADGRFTLQQVPIRFTALKVEDRATPARYTSGSAGLTLKAGEIEVVPVVQLLPNAAVIHDDVRTAIQYMIDNTSGKLGDYLASGSAPESGFRYSIERVPPGVSESLNRTEFIATVPGQRYYSISSESGYGQDPVDTTAYTCSFRCTWLVKDFDTHQRVSYHAEGQVQYGSDAGSKIWQLTGITLTGETFLPLAPTSVSAVGGDRAATVTWAVSSDTAVTGYRIYRSTNNDESGASMVKDITARTTASYVDSVPAAGTYYYWVRCVEVPPGMPAIESPSCPAGQAADVYDSLAVVQQFMAAACQGDTATMGNLLDSSFSGYIPGAQTVYGKQAFITWLAVTVFSAVSADPPAKRWEVPGTSSVARTPIGGGSELAVPAAYLVGRLGPGEANRRWSENETWRVSATTHKITYFSTPGRQFYPMAPTDFRCTNTSVITAVGYVALDWAAPIGDPDPDQAQPAGYYVLRSETPDWASAIRLPETGLITATSYDDYSIDIVKTYYYWVIAVDTYGAHTQRDEHMADYVMVGLPEGIQDTAETFIAASKAHDSVGVLSKVADSCDVLQETEGTTIEYYCTFTDFSLSGHWLLNFVKNDETHYTVNYGITCTWEGDTYTRLVLILTPDSLGEWKIISIDYTN